MRKVLVLDDNEDILQVVTEVLTYEEFEVKGLRTCASLIPEVEAFQPDLVLLDLRLADGHGGEMCRQLKAHPEFGETSVIIFTAYINPDDDLSAYGCDAVIPKPFDLEQLITTIDELTLTEN